MLFWCKNDADYQCYWIEKYHKSSRATPWINTNPFEKSQIVLLRKCNNKIFLCRKLKAFNCKNISSPCQEIRICQITILKVTGKSFLKRFVVIMKRRFSHIPSRCSQTLTKDWYYSDIYTENVKKIKYSSKLCIQNCFLFSR